MSWLLFYILVLAYPFLYFLIWKRNDNWQHRFIFWGLVTVPAVVYCWDYFYIQIEHERMCKAEAGLKVFIQPEKTDRVRFVGGSYGKSMAESTFFFYFPQARVVDAMTEERGPDGRRLSRFDTYTATPKTNPPMTVDPWKELPYEMTIAPLQSPDPMVYEIREETTNGKHYRREDWFLRKNGQLYARYTTFVHYWTGIQYPDTVPHWRCPDTNGPGVPPKDNPGAPQDKWIRAPSPDKAIQALIFN